MQSIFVGIYGVMIYIPLSKFINNKYILLFILGWIKHFFGFVFGLHSTFCNCPIQSNYNVLFIESILEGGLFVIMGTIYSMINLEKLVQIFMIGLTLHLLFEIVGIHKLFCNSKC